MKFLACSMLGLRLTFKTVYFNLNKLETMKIFNILAVLCIVLSLRYIDNLDTFNYVLSLFGCGLFFVICGQVVRVMRQNNKL